MRVPLSGEGTSTATSDQNSSRIGDFDTVIGAPVRGSDGGALGDVEAVYYDNDTFAPKWAVVMIGQFHEHVSIVPLSRGRWDGTALAVPTTGRP